MAEKTIQSRAVEVMAEQFGQPEDEIVLDRSFENDYDVDEVDRMELAMALEDEFEINMDDDRTTGIATVGEMIAYVTELVEAKKWH